MKRKIEKTGPVRMAVIALVVNVWAFFFMCKIRKLPLEQQLAEVEKKKREVERLRWLIMRHRLN